MKLNIDILLKLGKTEEAQSYVNQLVAEFQDLGDELLMLHSELALKTDDVKKAVNLLKKIDEKDEKLFLKSRLKLAEIFIDRIMDRRLYSWCFKEIVEKFPTLDNYKLAARSHLKVDMPDEAVEYFNKALEKEADYESDYSLKKDLGKALVRTHDYRNALAFYQQNCFVDDKNVNHQNVLDFWELINDFVELMYLFTDSASSGSEDKIKKISDLIKYLNDYCNMISKHLKKYEDFNIKKIYVNFLYISAKSLKAMFLENKVQYKNVIPEILKNLDKASSVIREVIRSIKENNNEEQLKKVKEFQSQILYELGNYYEIVEPKNNSSNLEKYYKSAIEEDGSNITALLAISNYFIKKNSFNEAEAYINMLLKEDESNDEALALLVSVLNSKKDSSSSITYLEKAINQQPNAYHLIELYIEMLRRNGNLSYVNDILYKNERNLKYTYTPGLYYCKGLYYKYMGEINKALIEFSKAKADEEYGAKCLEQMVEIYISPDSDGLLITLDLPWHLRGETGLINYYTDGLNLEAILFLIRELKVRQNDYKIQIYESYAAIITRDEEKIENKLKEIKELYKSNPDNITILFAYLLLNLVLKKIPELKASLEVFEKPATNIKYFNDYERGYLLAAYVMMTNDNFKKASEYLKKVLKMNIGSVKAYEFIALIKDKQGKYEESCAYYEKAWEYSYKNNASIGYKLAIAYINSKMHSRALNICNEIRRKFPDYPIEEIAQKAKNGLVG